MPHTAEADSADAPVVIVEDVWGPAFESLARRWPLVREPGAWQDPGAVRDLAATAAVLVVRNRTAVDRTVLEAGKRLAMVARAGVGLDNIDVAAADELGVVVSAARGANARSVAEMAMGLALAVARDIVGHDRRVRSGVWERGEGMELRDRTWGVIGLGATGMETARLARAFGMDTVGFDPYMPETVALDGLGQRVQSLEAILAAADVVSLHAPLTGETAGMAGAGFFEAMRPGAILVNVARGGLVDEEALVDALDAGRLAGAGLDVRTEEPPVAGRVEAHPRVVLTPHVAGITAEAQDRVAEALVADIDAVLAGRPATNAVGRWSRPEGDRPGGSVPTVEG
jgi:D-3-phosphoglycerate dehydrogenase